MGAGWYDNFQRIGFGEQFVCNPFGKGANAYVFLYSHKYGIRLPAPSSETDVSNG